MGKHRKNQHYRRMVVAAFSVSAVAIPSVALACTDWQDSGGDRTRSAATAAEVTTAGWKNAGPGVRQQHTWHKGHRHHPRHHDGTGHAGAAASAAPTTPAAPAATATASQPAGAASSAPQPGTHKPGAPRTSTGATAPATHKPATPGPVTTRPGTPATGTPAPTVTASAPASTPPAATTASGVVARIVQLVNAERAKVGCSPLTLNADLGKAAQAHSDDMAAHQNMSHTGSDGSSPGDRITSAGYSWSSYGENVAYGYSTPEQVMAAWMASPGHKANILNCGFQEIGVGLAEPGDYWTQDFGTAR